METVLKGMGKQVVIADGKPTVILGERINPTGKKKLAASLVAGELELVRQEALAQVEVGADILDVNVGAASVDEEDLLPSRRHWLRLRWEPTFWTSMWAPPAWMRRIYCPRPSNWSWRQ